MSTILSKLDTKKLSNVPEILEAYENRLNGWQANVKIDGKNIEAANVEQASWMAYYDEIKVELRTLVNFLEMKEKEIRGKLTRVIIDNSSLDHNERTRERMIDTEPEYIKIHQYYLLADETYRMADMIVTQFLQRAYALNNLVKIRVAQIQDITLYIDDR